MTTIKVWATIGLLLAAPALAADAPRTQKSPPKIHNSACALAESMASKLGYKAKLKHEVALQNCQMLVPTMNPNDHAEFMRCCLKRLEGGPAAGPAPKPTKPATTTDRT